MRYAEEALPASGEALAIDIGCGAARNAVPLARAGWRVFGTDTSWPMLAAAARRAASEGVEGRIRLAQATMAALPVASSAADLIVAHGIWNLARSSGEFRAAVREGARAAKPGAALFLFTFSRSTLADGAPPVPGETFVYSQFSGQPQVFLTAEQLLEELAAAGFVPDPAVLLRELNRPAGLLQQRSGPVIYEGTFRRT